MPIAISKAAADTIGMHLGDLVDAGSSLTGEPVRADVVGVYVANDPDDPYWVGLPCPERACREATAKVKWRTGGVVSPGATDRIAPWGGGATDFWRLPVDTAALRADQLDRTKEEISSYLMRSTALRLTTLTGREDLRVGSELPELFGQAVARRDAAAPLAAVGPAGLAGVAVVVLCLAAGLAGDRRHGELALLQARGGSRGGVVRRLLGEGAVTVVAGRGGGDRTGVVVAADPPVVGIDGRGAGGAAARGAGSAGPGGAAVVGAACAGWLAAGWWVSWWSGR